MSDLPGNAGDILLPVARAAIAERLGVPAATPAQHPEWLERPGASFVTLTVDGHLRGCIGSLAARLPLGADVAGNARAAAFRDPRFDPLGREDLAGVRVEVSVLDEPTPLTFASRADALAQLRPHLDGLILTAGGRRATFLPQVWRQLPDPAAFVDALLVKAGLRPGGWPRGIALERYGVRAWQEEP